MKKTQKIYKLMILSFVFVSFWTLVDLAQVEINTNNIFGKKKEQRAILSETKIVQYKKRIDYNKNPTSSEAMDYTDNIIQEVITPSQDLKKQENIPTIQEKYTIPKNIDSKPKVVIIIDDVLSLRQLNTIKSIDLKLTPSIFPNANNDVIDATKKLDFFMVHLPLEAKIYKDELDTIKTNDSIDRIKQKIQDIKKNMPNVEYINNHTGSKFTANKKSVETLLDVLDENKINFVDSRTTPDTKLNEIAKEQNRLILHRDIFLDNSLHKDDINKQINEGIRIAKKRGYAILIAHPHKETLQALKAAKELILNNVDVIYLNELDRMIKDSNLQYSQK